MLTRFRNSLRESYRRDPRPWFLAVVALLVYLPASLWGMPAFTGPDRCHGWGNDDLVPLAPLADAHNAFVQAKPDWNTAYPWFQFALLAVLFAPYLAYLKLTGGLGTVTGTFPFGLTDPVHAFTVMTVIGRSVSILLSVAMVVSAYHIGKRMVDRTTGVVAATIAMLIFPVAYYARVGNPDAAALGWLALTLAVLAACLDDGLTIRRGIWLALLAAATFNTKEQHGAALLLLIPVVWISALWRGPVQTWRRWQGRYVAPVITAWVFIAAFLITSGAIVAPTRFARHLGFFSVPFANKGTFVTRYPLTVEGFVAQLRDLLFFLADSLSWPLLVAAIFGVGLLMVKDKWKGAFVLSAVSYGLLLTYVRFSFIHYVTPLAFTLAPFAAFALVWLSRQGKALRAVSLVAGAWGAGLLLLQTVDLTYDMLHDSRYAATSWLRDHAPGSRVAYFGSKHFQPNYDASVVTIREEIRERALATIQNERPDYIIVNPDNTVIDRTRVEWRAGKYSTRNNYLPDEAFHELVSGRLGYRLVAQFQSPRLMPWLDRPFLSYPAVNIPVQIFAREDRAAGFPALTFWPEAPHYPRSYRVHEITPERLRVEFPESQF